MNKDESKRDTYFGQELKHALVEDFAVSYYNRTIKPDIARKSLSNGQDAKFLYYAHQAPRFDEVSKDSIISYVYDSIAPASYDVILRDKRFAELDELVDKYSDRIETPVTEKAMIENKLYSLILLLMKEGRIPQNFKLQPFRDAQVASLASQIERITKLLDTLEKRVKSIENNPYLRTGIQK